MLLAILLAASLNLEPVLEGLDRPVAIAHAGDGSGRLFIVQQRGKIVVYDGSQLLAIPFLDISPLVSCCNERGLLGLVFHPEYETNGLFYVNYTNVRGDTQIVRYRVSADPNVADPSSAALILEIGQPFANHNGGHLVFGPDRMLWIGTGDGGSAGDPRNNAQNGQSLLGKMLRVDVDAAFPYAIPGDNPFSSNADVRDEIWALGLRNPWKYSFDRLTGDLFIADVGQNAVEEVNFEAAESTGGRNYGWRRMEGTQCFDPRSGCNDGSLTLPILEYPHSEGCSVTGGYRYRGKEMPEQAGTYFFADFCSGDVWGGTLDEETGVWSRTLLADTSLAISTFGEDENGELYLASLGGILHRIHGETLCQVEPSAGGPVFQVANLSDRTLAVSFELRLDSRVVASAGADGSLLLPARFAMDVFAVPTGSPRGKYLLQCTFVDPGSGALVGGGAGSLVVR